MRVRRQTAASTMTMLGCISLSAFLAQVELGVAEEWRSPLVGGGGGTREYSLDCGNTSVLTGLNYKSGINLDNLSAICRRINSDGTLGPAFTGTTAGGTGGFAGTANCPAGKVAGSMTVWAGGIVNGIWLQCYGWNPSTRKLTTQTTGGLMAGGQGGFKQGPFACPDGKPGKSLRGKSGIYIDSVRLVCDDWNR